MKIIPRLRRKASDRQAREALSASGLTDELWLPPLVKGLVGLSALAATAFLLWAGKTELHEMTTARGQVIPDGYVRVVQHLEGGIVGEILVTEGQRVKRGDLLLRLQGSGNHHDLSEYRLKQQSLALQAERLRAFVEGRRPDFAAVLKPDVLSPEEAERRILEQQRIYDGMLEARQHEQSVIATQIRQRQEMLGSYHQQRETLTRSLELAREARDLQKNLLDKGLSRRMLFLDKETVYNSTLGELKETDNQIRQAKQSIAEFQVRLVSLKSRYQEDANHQLEQAESQLAQNAETLGKLHDRVDRLQVTAPVDGLVKGIAVHTIGGVVGAGQTLMEIVPVGEKLVIEARISPEDIGHIHTGSPVQVKVHSFDYVRYGTIEGKVMGLSATTFRDEEDKSFYRGHIELARNYAGFNPDEHRILPGMTVDADIITGRKSILAYLLKPIHIAADNALKER